MDKIRYIIRAKAMNGVIREFEAYGRVLNDALQNFCKKCIKEDDTGIFFELEDADLNYYKKNPYFHAVHIEEGDYGIVLDSLKVDVPERNRYLCELRAKRELLGLSIPQVSELAGAPSYKSKECGSRDMPLSEYARLILALEEYEAERLAEMDRQEKHEKELLDAIQEYEKGNYVGPFHSVKELMADLDT